MANELLKTLTIDGVSNDTMGIGDYLALDSNNNVKIPFEYVLTPVKITVPSGTTINQNLHTTTKAGLVIAAYGVAFPSSATGVRYSALLHEGGTVASQRGMPAPTGQTFQTGCGTIYSAVGEVFSIRLYQSSGSSMEVTVNATLRIIPKYNSV